MLSRTRQILIIIVALAILFMLWFTGNKTKELVDVGPSADEASAVATAEPDFSRGVPRDGTLDPISIDPEKPANRLPQYQAETIRADYAADPVAADKRYRGVYFIIEGIASGIRRDDANQVFVDIRTNDANTMVRGTLLQRQICGPGSRLCEAEARATMVRRGQKVALECNGAGVVEGSPVLVDCLLRGGAN
jgi:hypothetical protein